MVLYGLPYTSMAFFRTFRRFPSTRGVTQINTGCDLNHYMKINSLPSNGTY